MAYFIWIALGACGFFSIALLLTFIRFKLATIDMTFLEFIRRLIMGGGFKTLSAREFSLLSESERARLLIVDIREKRGAGSAPIQGAIVSSFDEFLKEVTVDERYARDEPILLICDSGHMSRVAANILVEDEGFTEVYNLAGGMERLTRWQRRSTSAPWSLSWIARCCASS